MPQIKIVQHQAEDYAVERCPFCGREYDQRERVEDRSVEDFELVWICPCGSPNPMSPWNCDCGEDPCITEYAFGCGPSYSGACPSTGLPW